MSLPCFIYILRNLSDLSRLAILSLPVHHHPQHNRRTEHRCHGADTQFRRCKHRPCDQVTQQTEHTAAEKTCRYHQDRLVAAEQIFDQLRHRDANK